MPRLIENRIQFPYKRSLGPVFGAFMTALVGRKILGIRNGDQVEGANVALGQAYGANMQYFAMWVVANSLDPFG